MLVISKVHRALFRPPEKILTDVSWPEQNHFNARLLHENVPVSLLPQSFNDRHRQGDYLRKSYVLHYSVAPLEKRIESAHGDRRAWNLLFHRNPAEQR